MTSLDPRTRDFYRSALLLMKEAGPPFLVGGAYALECHTGISRHTKDFDVFVAPDDAARVLSCFESHGFKTEWTHPHWLAKVYQDGAFVDVIYRSGNGLAEVDACWIDRGVEGEVFGLPVRLCAAEEMIWSKAFIMERERFDGADVAHLLRAQAEQMDWDRLLSLFGPYWQALYTHLILFGFIYPSERNRLPRGVLSELARRLETEADDAVPHEPVCQGTLFSRSQYLKDVEEWGYIDARMRPRGRMTPGDVAAWTAAIARDGSL